MAEAAMLGLAACQLVVAVVPMAMNAWPIVWKQVVKTFKRLPRSDTDEGVNKSLATIHAILDILEHIPDLPWASLNHGQALLSSMKLQAESLEKVLVKGSALRRYFRKAKIARRINEIASTMLLFQFQMNVLASITEVKQNAYCDIQGPVQSYERSKRDLHNDLLAKLCEDNLEPMVIKTSKEYANMTRSDTYRKVSYSFQPASGYPRTLTVSRGVRECIEVLLRWLGDLKSMRQDTSNVESAGVIGVAFIEVFTEILPEALLHHLCESCSRLEPRAALQFDKNLEFFRSFSKSATFKAIQGKHGLDLEDTDMVSLDLQDSGWTAWNLALQVSVQLQDREAANNHRLPVRSSSRDATLTTSGYADPAVCVLCGIFIDIAGNPVNTEHIRKQHFETCIQKRKRLIAGSTSGDRCPVYETCWDHLPKDETPYSLNWEFRHVLGLR